MGKDDSAKETNLEEELTNSILYIKSKNEELIDKKILVPVAFRQWKLRLK